MSEESPTIPENVAAAHAQQQSGISIGILAIVCSVFCMPVGITLGIIGLCKYPAKSAGKILSVVGLAFSGILIAVSIGAGYDKCADTAYALGSALGYVVRTVVHILGTMPNLFS